MYFGYVCFLVKDQKSKMVAIVEKNYNIEGGLPIWSTMQFGFKLNKLVVFEKRFYIHIPIVKHYPVMSANLDFQSMKKKMRFCL
jgi:hypothetical protein